MFAKAQKHGITLPYASVEAVRRLQLWQPAGVPDLYYAGADVLRDQEDFTT